MAKSHTSHKRGHNARTDNVHAFRRQERRIEEGCGACGDGTRGRGGSVAVVTMLTIEDEVEAASVTLCEHVSVANHATAAAATPAKFWAQEALEEANSSLGFCTSGRALAALLGNATELARFRAVTRREEVAKAEF